MSTGRRRSRWAEALERRLLLAKELLNPVDSVLIVTIDEKEYLRPDGGRVPVLIDKRRRCMARIVAHRLFHDLPLAVCALHPSARRGCGRASPAIQGAPDSPPCRARPSGTRRAVPRRRPTPSPPCRDRFRGRARTRASCSRHPSSIRSHAERARPAAQALKRSTSSCGMSTFAATFCTSS